MLFQAWAMADGAYGQLGNGQDLYLLGLTPILIIIFTAKRQGYSPLIPSGHTLRSYMVQGLAYVGAGELRSRILYVKSSGEQVP